jgi:lipopolysaccharide/colanic/teichoic acid biosynthesis glycosyltransferase
VVAYDGELMRGNSKPGLRHGRPGEIFKRVSEIAAATTILLCLAPILLITSVAIS